MIKNYIIIGLVSLLIIFSIFISFKCSKLERENIELKNDKNNITEFFEVENKRLENEILLLETSIDYYQHQIDSLKKVKQKIIIKTEYVVSEDITKSVSILKENLKWEKR